MQFTLAKFIGIVAAAVAVDAVPASKTEAVCCS